MIDVGRSLFGRPTTGHLGVVTSAATTPERREQ
jgi:hypothetical protein